MPVPQPARSPLAQSDDSYLHERYELIAKKYAAGLGPQETKRLTEIEEYLDGQDVEKADLIDIRRGEQMGRIDAALDRVEKAIRDLQTLKLN